MARPHSLDLRRRIVEAVETGLSRRGAAERFAVSESSAIKLMQRWERTGSVAPGAMGGAKKFVLAPHEQLVRTLVSSQRDITLAELQARLKGEAIEVSIAAIHRFLRALGLTHKKRRSTRPSRTALTSPRLEPSGGRSRRR
jgi:transposase